jgi:hypothetical protein
MPSSTTCTSGPCCSAHRWLARRPASLPAGSVQIQIVTAAQAEAARLAPSLHNSVNTNDSWTPLYVRLPRLCSCKQDCPVPASSAAPEFELSSVRHERPLWSALAVSALLRSRTPVCPRARVAPWGRAPAHC